MASTYAEIIALALYYPFELIKVRFLTKNDVYKYFSATDAIKKIYKKDSVKGLYRGLSAFFLAYLG